MAVREAKRMRTPFGRSRQGCEVGLQRASRGSGPACAAFWGAAICGWLGETLTEYLVLGSSMATTDFRDRHAVRTGGASVLLFTMPVTIAEKKNGPLRLQ